MKRKIEDMVVGGVWESIQHVTGTIKAVKILAYTLVGAIAMIVLGGFAYAIYNLIY